MVPAQAGCGADTVEQRHVQVEHDRIRVEVVRELDRLEAVKRGSDDGQFRLSVDQSAEGVEEGAIVVCDQNADGRLIRARVIHLPRNASLAAVVAQGPLDPVAVIGVPLDLGAGRRGVDMGPSAIRYAGLEPRIEDLGRRCVDWGDVVAAVAEASAVGDERVRFLPQIKETCERIAELVARAVEEGFVPLVLGGDHSVALGTLGGLTRAAGKGGVLWFDAHGDLNRPGTSPSGNVHGMPLAASLGLAGPEFDSEAYPLPALEPSRVALFGVRSLDPAERELLAELAALVFTMSDLDRVGVEPAMREALEHVAGPGSCT